MHGQRIVKAQFAAIRPPHDLGGSEQRGNGGGPVGRIGRGANAQRLIGETVAPGPDPALPVHNRDAEARRSRFFECLRGERVPG